jgi:hypothetical protein
MEKQERVPHEYLQREDYYENNPVQKGRMSKICSHCGGNIAKGTAHDVHKFYPEFQSEPTHKKCSAAFIESLRTPEDGPIE